MYGPMMAAEKGYGTGKSKSSGKQAKMKRMGWVKRLSPAIMWACLQLPAFPAESADPAARPAAGGCDTSKNHEKWYLSYRECGSQGTQISMLANVSAREVRGSQVSLLANVATDDVERVQIAGSLNIARRASAQILADVNIAQHVRVIQVGCVNIADTVDGTQLGFVNVANRLDGMGIGFLTLAGNGLLHVDASVDETGMQRLAFASGKGFFTSYSLGYTIGYGAHPYGFGMGAGYHQGFGKRLHAEAEFHGSLVMDRHTRLEDLGDEDKMPGDDDWRHNLLFQGKLRLGGNLFRGVGLFAGATYNALVFGKNERLVASWSEELTRTSRNAAFWPGLEVGIRLGR
jgi:hypothetical protein